MKLMIDIPETLYEVTKDMIRNDMGTSTINKAIANGTLYESCKDAISRQAMHIELEKWITYGEYKYSNATKYLFDRIDKLPPVNLQEPLTEEDYIELRDRFGEYVAFVVRDMVSGKGERWKRRGDNIPQYCDRNICISNEYNGIGCKECEVIKSQESLEVEVTELQKAYNKGFNNCKHMVLVKKELVELEDGQSFYCISPEDVEALQPINAQEPKTDTWSIKDVADTLAKHGLIVESEE